MKRPLLFILSFLVLGILYAYFIPNNFVFIFVVAFCICIILYKIYKLKFCMGLWIFTIIGVFLTNLSNDTYILKDKEKVNVIGYVKNIEKTKNKYKLYVSSKNINNENKKLNFLVYTDDIKDIKNGALVNIYGTIRYPKSKTNPNGYDESLNFKINKISYKLYAEKIQIFGYKKLPKFMYDLKNKIFSIYDEILPETESSILKAMILGDKSYLDDDVIDAYRTSGIYHILSISGLHIGILAIFLTKIFKLISRRFGYIFVIVVLIFYCTFTGSNLSTVRATIMSTIVLIGYVIYKEPDFLSSISLSAIICLLNNPYYIFDIGFLYSYTSVFAIAFIGARFCNLYKLNGIVKAFVVSFFVTLAIKPITAYNFYNFTLLDCFFNILIIPFMSIVVIISFLTTIVGMISLPIAKFLIGIVYYILRLFMYMCKVIELIPFNNIIIGKPSILVILGVYLMLIFIGYAIYDRHIVYKRKKFITIGMCIFILFTSISIFIPKKSKIVMLDIGQGDSIVGIGKISFLIDGGGSKNFSTGDNIIIPYLKSEGINRLNFVFVSHNDTDHIGGIIDIIGKVKIDYLFMPINNSLDENYNLLISKADENDIPIYYLKSGDNIVVNDNISFEILHPNIKFNGEDDNNNSLVINYKFNDKNILFTGDIEKEAEQFLVENNLLPTVDILKVAHHGSKTSTTKEFVEKVSPKVALISCKNNNKYKHPHSETLKVLTDDNINIYRTDKQGAITIYFENDKIKIMTVNDN